MLPVSCEPRHRAETEGLNTVDAVEAVVSVMTKTIQVKDDTHDRLSKEVSRRGWKATMDDVIRELLDLWATIPKDNNKIDAGGVPL